MLWISFSCMLAYSAKKAVPFVRALNINSDFIAIDSNWHDDRFNRYHNDALLYTILRTCVCYTSEDCWYKEYFIALGKEVIIDDKLVTKTSDELLENKEYIEIGFSRATNNRFLYSEAIYTELLNIEKKTKQATRLFLDPRGIKQGSTCVILNDEKGNIYVKAR